MELPSIKGSDLHSQSTWQVPVPLKSQEAGDLLPNQNSVQDVSTSTLLTWGGIMLCCGAILCIAGCSEAPVRCHSISNSYDNLVSPDIANGPSNGGLPSREPPAIPGSPPTLYPGPWKGVGCYLRQCQDKIVTGLPLAELCPPSRAVSLSRF